MFLTGFDSKYLNTLYVDKNLRYHGLIQAYSRTNRIINELKSQGNIVCFRNLKPATDDAIRLFSNLDNKDEIISPPSLINGNDLINELDLKPGPIIGKILRLIQEAQATGKVNNQRQALELATDLLEEWYEDSEA